MRWSFRALCRLAVCVCAFGSAAHAQAQAQALTSPKQIKQGAVTGLQSISTTDKDLQKKISSAEDDISQSLSNKTTDFFLDDWRILPPPSGLNVFNQEEKATDDLGGLLKDRDTPASIRPFLQRALDALMQADREIAELSLVTAERFVKAGQGDAKVVIRARQQFDQAAKETDPKKAIEGFKNVWQSSQEVANKNGLAISSFSDGPGLFSSRITSNKLTVTFQSVQNESGNDNGAKDRKDNQDNKDKNDSSSSEPGKPQSQQSIEFIEIILDASTGATIRNIDTSQDVPAFPQGADDSSKLPTWSVTLMSSWDGKDNSGQIAKDGTYNYVAFARIVNHGDGKSGSDGKKDGNKDDNKDEPVVAVAFPVSGSVMLDSSPPNITAVRDKPPNAAGWNNTNVTVSFVCSDAIDSVTCPAPVSVTTEGANQRVSGTAVDVAGNTAAVKEILNIDKTPPSIAAVEAPQSNAANWNNSDVTVSFAASDALSGLANVTSPVIVRTEGANQRFVGTAVDVAGNVANAVAIVNLDKTRPTLTFGAAAPDPNAAGWNKTNVTVPFVASDALSGVASTSVSTPLTLSAEGASVSGTVTVMDVAGNSATFTSPSVKIDKTAPAVTITSPLDGVVVNSASLALNGTATDAVSGLAALTCNGVPVTPLQSPFTCNLSLTPGPNPITVSATDMAGNVGSSTINVTFQSNPLLVSVNPSSGQQGQEVNVNLTGLATHWVQGTTKASFSGIFVASLTVTSPTTATAILEIDIVTNTGPVNVTMQTGTEVATLNNGFTVTPGTPALDVVNPNRGQQGDQNVNVVLLGEFTHWVQGTTTASFGPGITVVTLTVNSATTATTVLNIDPAAATGPRNVTLTTGAEVVALKNGFTVNPATPVLQTVSPNTGPQGQQNQNVNLTGQFTHWVQGTTTVDFASGITVVTLTVNSATSATAVLNIDPGATIGNRVVTVTTGTEVVFLSNGFAVAPGTPVLTLSVNTGQQGKQNLIVNLTAQFTHWVQGTTTSSFGPGIMVATLTVNSSTTATAVLNIDPAAVPGSRNVTVTTGAEVVTLNNGFTVGAGTLVLQIVKPNAEQQGLQNQRVYLAAQFTHWVQGTTTASFGTGITVIGVTVYSMTAASAILNIDPAAGLGSRNVTVTTGAEVVTLSNGFTVITSTPTVQPPPPDPTVVTNVGMETQFLYTGPNAVQTGVATGTINMIRAGVVHGKVMNPDGSALPGVTITILSHPEFGQTLSRADGIFDMAVNGGGPMIVNYKKSGLFSAQRLLNVPWQDFALAPDVILIPPDTASTVIDAATVPGGPLPPFQVARGTPMTDSDGTRQATLMFPVGVTADMVMPGGSKTALNRLTVRATEYTVGPNGPQAMAAMLPPTSAYTYAVEFSVDEAKAAGAIDVRFSTPLPFYVENFLGFPVGTSVPLGSYNRTQGAWIPYASGVVVKILSFTNGKADLDINGSGVAASQTALAALQISDPERQQLATLYQVGQTLWRVLIPHFDDMYDCNLAYGLPNNAVPPDGDPQPDPPVEDSCKTPGSIIACQNQTLGEVLGVVGTGFTLHYQSERTPGHKAAYTVEIPLSGSQVPSRLKRIDLEIQVAGRLFQQSFPSAPNQQTTFTWDGKDAYGRMTQGAQPMTVRTGYTYDFVYGVTDRFGAYAAVATAVTSRQEITLWHTWQRMIGSWDARAVGLGGWTLSLHHMYGPNEKVVYQGDGTFRGTSPIFGGVITELAGTGAAGFSGDGGPATNATLNNPRRVAVAADGSFYIVDSSNFRVRRVGPDGIITTVAGNGTSNFSGDGGQATAAGMFPSDVAVAPDGSVYILDQAGLFGGAGRVRRVGPDGIITTVAGNGTSCSAGVLNCQSGDGGPATQATLLPNSIAVGPDGILYIASDRVRRVGPDGIITTVAGGGFLAAADGSPATQVSLTNTGAVFIALARDGSWYISDTFVHVWRLGPDGILHHFAGGGTPPFSFSGDGGPATQASLNGFSEVAVARDGTVYIVDQAGYVIRRVGTDGIINSVVNAGLNIGFGGDGGLATQASLNGFVWIAVAPDGSIYIADRSNQRVRRVASALPGFSAADFGIPSAGGNELYRFNSVTGRHVQTINTLTGAVLDQFSYDAGGHLASITDGDGNVTTIVRDSTGNPTAIVAPHGQRTTLAVDANGFLSSVTSPAGEMVQLAYTPDGLLTSLIKPARQNYTYAYDTLGRLTSATDATRATKTLVRSGGNADYTVTLTSALGRKTSYRVTRLSTGDLKQTITDAAGLQTQVLTGKDGKQTTTESDGTVIAFVFGPDPRWSMSAPLATSETVTTPGKLQLITTLSRTVSLSDPANALSLTQQTDNSIVNGQTYTQVYNAANRTFTTTSPAGRTSTATIDPQGRIVLAQPGNLLPVALTYDAQGRLSTVTQGSGASARTTTLAYDAASNLASFTDPLQRVNSFRYDANGRPLQIQLPDLQTAAIGYDLNSNVTSVSPPGRTAYTFDYTSIDELASDTPPSVGIGTTTTNYSYNQDRQLSDIARPDGLRLDLSYQTDGRLSTLTVPAGQISFGYDSTSGLVNSVSAPSGVSLAFARDGALPTAETWTGPVPGSVSAAYDNNFRVTSQSLNGTALPFQYDNDSFLTQAGSLSIQRDATTGLVTATTLGTVSDATAYNGFAEFASYSASSGSTTLYNVQYTRDNLGRIMQKTETIGATTDTFAYTYDVRGRLVQVQKDGAVFSTYSYDANGNRVSATAGGTTTATYDVQDRLTAYGSTAYTYSANGELQSATTGGQTTNYQYDVLGDLLSVTLPNSTQIGYIVDGRSRRVAKRVNGAVVQQFLYQGRLSPIAELNGNGNVVSRFVYATRINVPDYMIKGGNTYRMITDHAGSPRLVVDISTGAVAQRLDYDEFGNVTNDTNPGFQPFGFAGGLYDRDTKLLRFGARDYDPTTGRWTAKDPGGFYGEPNLYTYAYNDPVNLIDPLGKSPKSPQGYGWNELNRRLPPWEPALPSNPNVPYEPPPLPTTNAGSSPVSDVSEAEAALRDWAKTLTEREAAKDAALLECRSALGGAFGRIALWAGVAIKLAEWASDLYDLAENGNVSDRLKLRVLLPLPISATYEILSSPPETFLGPVPLLLF